MNDTLKILSSLVFSSSLLIVIIAIALKLFGTKLKKSWQYYIWLIVALRLIIPFGFGDVIAEQLPPNSTIETAFDSTDVLESNPVNNNLVEQNQSNFIVKSIDQIDSNTILTGLFFVWIVGAIVLFVRKLTLYQSFLKYIRAGKSQLSDIEELEVFSELCETMNIKKTVDLTSNELIGSPLLIGYRKPKVVLPSFEFTTEEKNNIYLHELTHLKRRDILYKCLLQGIQCIYWFHPFVYYMIRKINELCELSCDEAVLETLSKEEATQYGETLLNSLNIKNSYNEPMATLALSENAMLLSRRIDNIKAFQKPILTKKLICILLVITLCITAIFTGGYSTFAKMSDENAINPNQFESFVVDDTVKTLIQNGGSNDGIWYIVEFLIPYMTNDGIDEAVNQFNGRYTGDLKVSSDYYNLPIPTQSETLYRANNIINRTNELELVLPLFPYMSKLGIYEVIELYNSKNGYNLNPEDYARYLFLEE